MDPRAEKAGLPPAPGADDDQAWARVVAAWSDEAAHRAYVAGLADLDQLAAAGRRYRAALAERPGDAIALRALGDIVRRATVQGLAALPRARPPRRLSPRVRRLLVLLAALGLAALSVSATRALHGLLGARP